MSIEETFKHFNEKFPLELRYSSQPVPNTAVQGYSDIYRSSTLRNKETVEVVHPELNTLSKFFANAVRKFPNENCLGERKFNNTKKNQFDDFYSFQSYKEIQLRKDKIASGILYLVTNHKNYASQLQSTSGKDEFIVSILAPNRLEWLLIDLATRDYSLTNTALYPTLGKGSSKHILEITESPIIFLNKDQIPKILELKESGALPDLLIMVSLDEFNSKDHGFFPRCEKVGISLIDLQTVEKTGERNLLPTDYNPPNPDTVYTISFTSGTTGNPKGVVLTHRIATAGVSAGILGLVGALNKTIPKSYNDYNNNKSELEEQITSICHLPLAHIYQRQLTNLELSVGYASAMLSRPEDARFLFEDVKCLKPHYLASVPRVWNKLEALFKQVLKAQFGEELLNLDNFINLPQLEKSKIQAALKNLVGFNRLKFMFTGSAPLGIDTIKFLRTVLGVGLSNGYGLTESFAGCCLGDPFEDDLSNNSGPPGISTEMRLKDCKELGYSVSDQPFIRGELQLRGPQVFSHYYKNPQATKEAVDSEGWFSTGDIATIDQYGRLYIIDRVKNFFKLSQGEYITPEKIENIYLANSPMLTQIFVHGDSLQNYLVGVAGIASDFLINMMKSNHNLHINSEDELLNLLKTKKFKTLIVKELNKSIKNGDLQGFEKIHNLHFAIEPLKIEDEVLTPTLKLKRNNARKKFEKILQNLYDEGSLIKNEKL